MHFLKELYKHGIFSDETIEDIRDEFDGETIGIILCKGKKEVTMEYALGGLSNNIFTSSYTYYIPNKEQLINEVEKVLHENDENI